MSGAWVFQVQVKPQQNIQVKNDHVYSYMALRVGRAAAWNIPTDGATTALPGSPFHTGIVLMKKECLYALMEA